MKAKIRAVLFFLGVCLLTPYSDGVMGNTVVPPSNEVKVIGVASSVTHQDQVYRDALYDALSKAVAKVSPGVGQTMAVRPDLRQDLDQFQKLYGIVGFQVLRYWMEQNMFYIEVRVRFGASAAERPWPESPLLQPKLEWVYQTEDSIQTVSKGPILYAVNGTRRIELVQPKDGKRVQWYDIGLKPHSVYGERYAVHDGKYLKVYSLNRFDFLKWLWRKKLPALVNHFQLGETIVTVERSGMVRAWDWEKGTERWSVSTAGPVTVRQAGGKDFLLIFPGAEVWWVGPDGAKRWLKKWAGEFAAEPVVNGHELFCLMAGGDLRVVDLTTGREVTVLKTDVPSTIFNAKLAIRDQMIITLYNDALTKRGVLQAFHRFNGARQWKVELEGPAGAWNTATPETIIIGTGNVIEAREVVFGLKIWEESVYGVVGGINYYDRKLVVSSENRLYSFGY